MLPDKETRCHMTGFNKTCFKCVTEFKCKKWVQILGINPQTGQEINKWDCVDALLPLLQIESSRKMNEVGAAIESFRNQSMEIARHSISSQIDQVITSRVEQQKALPNGSR